MARGTNDEFDELHGVTLRIITKMMKAAEAGMLVDEDGHVTMPSPALIAQSIKLLKENGIDKPAPTGKKEDTLKDAMPDFDELEGGNVVAFRK